MIYLSVSLFSSCSQILQTVNLQINTKDTFSSQDNFNVVERTLTIKEALKQSRSPYMRTVSQSGRGEKAKTISERLVLQSKFPEQTKQPAYKIGIGDTLTFSRLIENNQSKLENKSTWPENLKRNSEYLLGVGDELILTLLKEENVLSKAVDNGDQNSVLVSQNELKLETKGRIGSDGSVLLLEVGRLEAKGKSLNELQSEVRNIFIRNGTSPRFQLGIVGFRSKKAYITINQESDVIFLNDQKATIREILTAAQVGFKPGVITRIRLQRGGKEYLMPLRSIFSQNAPDIIIQANDHIFVEDSSSNIITSEATVGNDGKIVLAGVGSIKANGLSLLELRLQIAELIEKLPDSENAFQVRIQKSSSQVALISIPGGGKSSVIPIDTIPPTLDRVLVDGGLSLNGDTITRIKLHRQNKIFIFTLNDLLNPNTPKIYLQANDQVTVEFLPYKESKVFILGGVDPKIFKINPSKRETLADVLFTSGGVLSSSKAKRSEVYLLRGINPVIAYHLDAQSPTRLIVAEKMQLRPNDILYVAEQPIISFNRTLATILPLRVLIRDIRDENIP